MLTKTKAALAAALVVGSASFGAVSAFAGGNSGDYSGGYVMPGSTAGVNPVYHPGWFGQNSKGTDAYDLAVTKGSKAYGYVTEGVPAPGTGAGEVVNGNFIPRGTSPAQIPSHHQEDDYGSGAGRD